MSRLPSPFNPPFEKSAKNCLIDWLLVSTGLFLVLAAIGQHQGWLTEELPVSLTTFETIDNSSNGTVFVDIAGAVANPGLYQLPTNSRVDDLLVACNGVTAWADRSFLEKSLNRARILQDGEKIYIPYRGQESLAQTATDTDQTVTDKININLASLEELMTLSGIGEKYAQAIIDYRQSIGPFSSLEEIKEVSGIGEKTFTNIKDEITI